MTRMEKKLKDLEQRAVRDRKQAQQVGTAVEFVEVQVPAGKRFFSFRLVGSVLLVTFRDLPESGRDTPKSTISCADLQLKSHKI